MKAAPWIIAMVFAFVLIRGCNWMLTPTSSSPATAQVPADPDAGVRGACMTFLERSLHDPGSAEWGDISTWTVVHNSDGTLSVGARYSARNGFNAVRKAYTTCVIRKTSDGFQLVNLAQMR